ncbi:NifB/NifX family molybdenum-iron cluster-binding protein [Mangrovibacterium sp.]|uniref:NifB/NifX family molybdenum-iron cluster-binding protein n=1 Tax=Mangrovibacterium sp. TaxID=1961364 RepID=UPI003561F8A6
MMKIAIPTKDNQVDDHFGHCEYFTVYELNEKKEIVNESQLTTSKECGCKSNLAHELAAEKVNVMLASGIGEGAIRKLKENNIEVIAGFKCSVKEAMNKYIRQDYFSNFTICTDHHECSH